MAGHMAHVLTLHMAAQHLGNQNELEVWFPDPTTAGRESRCSRGRSATSTPALVFAQSQIGSHRPVLNRRAQADVHPVPTGLAWCGTGPMHA